MGRFLSLAISATYDHKDSEGNLTMHINSAALVLHRSQQRLSRRFVAGGLGFIVLMAGAGVGYTIAGKPMAPAASAAPNPQQSLPTVTAPLGLKSSVKQVEAKMLAPDRSYHTLTAHLTSTFGDGRIVTDANLVIQHPNRFRVEASDGQHTWTAVSDGTKYLDP